MIAEPRYLQRHELDVQKWNDCITRADNGLVYGYSWWLDAMAVQWSGLVWNNYEAVMPLTWKRKYGISYLYQPWFTPSLGLFCKESANLRLVDFLRAIPPIFRYWDMDVNEGNHVPREYDPRLKIWERNNLWIPAQDYNIVRQPYSRLARRSLKKGVQNNVEISNTTDIATVVQHYQQHYAKAHPAIRSKDYERLIAAGTHALQKGYASAYTAMLEGELAGCYLVLHDSRYAYSLMGGSTATGKASGAFYLLTDHAIRMAMESNRSFRFEGSDMPGVAFFNQQFGPKEIRYLHLQKNNLPYPLRWLK